VVPTITPALPAAKHAIALGQLTPWSGCAVPEVCGSQADPLLVVKILPELARAEQVVLTGQLTALNVSVTPVGVWSLYVVQPSPVLTIVDWPTA
jgi:hypothetical protein